jgi:hypothetical protein
MPIFAETTWDIDAIKRANRNHGYYFFDTGAIRFFRSRVSQNVYQGVGGIYFVTSEQSPSGIRAYTVRQFQPATGNVQTAGPFHQLTRAKAVRLALNLSLGKVTK